MTDYSFKRVAMWRMNWRIQKLKARRLGRRLWKQPRRELLRTGTRAVLDGMERGGAEGRSMRCVIFFILVLVFGRWHDQCEALTPLILLFSGKVTCSGVPSYRNLCTFGMQLSKLESFVIWAVNLFLRESGIIQLLLRML